MEVLVPQLDIGSLIQQVRMSEREGGRWKRLGGWVGWMRLGVGVAKDRFVCFEVL